LPGIADELLPLEAPFAATLGFGRAATFLVAAATFFFAIGFDRAARADFPADPAFFLADACGFALRFVVTRLAERGAGPFRADLAGVARRAALRLAIAPVLSEP
jgi:hypothetical protein